MTQATEFIDQDYAEDAVRLRQWDDTAKVVGAKTVDLQVFVAMMEKLSLEFTQPETV